MTIGRIGFAYNPTNEAAVELAARASGWCQMRGVGEWQAQASDLDRLHAELPTTDALVVLGGDGTFLRAARAVADVDVPLLGLNLGKVGFLSKAEAGDLETVLGHLVDGAFTIDERMIIEGRILRGGRIGEDERHIALNDIVIARGALARVCRLDVSIDGSHLATFIADGLVVASPTGSTGYSFSAGGPILDPVSRNLVVTPIAAYLSAIRSVVVSPPAGRALPGRRRLRGARLGRRPRGPARSRSATSSRSTPWSDRSGSSNRRAPSRSGTSSATRWSCCRRDRRRGSGTGGPPARADRHGPRPHRPAASAARGRPERPDRRDRGRQEPAHRCPRTGARCPCRHDAGPPRVGRRAGRGTVRPPAGAAHRRPRGHDRRAFHGAPGRRHGHRGAAGRRGRSARRDPRPARPGPPARRALAARPARRLGRPRGASRSDGDDGRALAREPDRARRRGARPARGPPAAGAARPRGQRDQRRRGCDPARPTRSPPD